MLPHPLLNHLTATPTNLYCQSLVRVCERDMNKISSRQLSASSKSPAKAQRLIHGRRTFTFMITANDRQALTNTLLGSENASEDGGVASTSGIFDCTAVSYRALVPASDIDPLFQQAREAMAAAVTNLATWMLHARRYHTEQVQQARLEWCEQSQPSMAFTRAFAVLHLLLHEHQWVFNTIPEPLDETERMCQTMHDFWAELLRQETDQELHIDAETRACVCAMLEVLRVRVEQAYELETDPSLSVAWADFSSDLMRAKVSSALDTSSSSSSSSDEPPPKRSRFATIRASLVSSSGWSSPIAAVSSNHKSTTPSSAKASSAKRPLRSTGENSLDPTAFASVFESPSTPRGASGYHTLSFSSLKAVSSSMSPFSSSKSKPTRASNKPSVMAIFPDVAAAATATGTGTGTTASNSIAVPVSASTLLIDGDLGSVGLELCFTCKDDGSFVSLVTLASHSFHVLHRMVQVALQPLASDLVIEKIPYKFLVAPESSERPVEVSSSSNPTTTTESTDDSTTVIEQPPQPSPQPQECSSEIQEAVSIGSLTLAHGHEMIHPRSDGLGSVLRQRLKPFDKCVAVYICNAGRWNVRSGSIASIFESARPLTHQSNPMQCNHATCRPRPTQSRSSTFTDSVQRPRQSPCTFLDALTLTIPNAWIASMQGY